MVLWITWKLFYYSVMKWIPLHTHTLLYCHGNWDPTVKHKDWCWWGRWQSLGTTVLEKFVFLLPAGLRVIIKMPTFLWLFPLMIDCLGILQIGLSVTRSSVTVSFRRLPLFWKHLPFPSIVHCMWPKGWPSCTEQRYQRSHGVTTELHAQVE